MQKKETAIEVKVGALVLFALGLLVAFVLVLGDFTVSKGFEFDVEFENAGGLKPGADVAIAGLNVGSVKQLKFVKNDKNPAMNIVVVRATVSLQRPYAESVREDSQLFITTRGVLGEPYIEIVTERFDKPAIKPGAVLRGVDPPRIDLIIAQASKLLTVLTNLLDNPEIAAKELLAQSAALVKTLNDILLTNRADIDGTIKGVRVSVDEASKLLGALNVGVDGGQEIKNIVQDVRQATTHLSATSRRADRISAKLDGNLDGVLDDVAKTASNSRQLTDSAKRVLTDNEQRLASTLANLDRASSDVAAITADSRVMVGKVKQGEGTVGQLLSDRELYDDMKELLRQIKRKPWKIIWKE